MLQVLAEVHRPSLELLLGHGCGQVSSLECHMLLCTSTRGSSSGVLPVLTAHMPCQSVSSEILSRIGGSC